MTFRLGITGSRWQPDEPQLIAAAKPVLELANGDAVRVCQGCCTGFDTELTRYLKLAGRRVWVCGHPPKVTTFLDESNFSLCDEIMPADGYLERDRAIVRHGRQALVSGPKEYYFRSRGSGCWYTTKYGLLQGRDTYLVFPGGEVAEAQLVEGALTWKSRTSTPS
jgi:hypothetical protein